MRSLEDRRSSIEGEEERLSIRRQCALLGLARSSLCYTPVAPDRLTLKLMHAMDREYIARPFFGVRKMTLAMRASRASVSITSALPA